MFGQNNFTELIFLAKMSSFFLNQEYTCHHIPSVSQIIGKPFFNHVTQQKSAQLGVMQHKLYNEFDQLF